jgi:antitoxin MazE
MRVSKWGDSLAIRLPAAVVETLKLKAGDEINIRVAGAGDFIVEREMTRKDAVAKLRAAGKPFPRAFKFDRREAMPGKAFLDTDVLVYAFSLDDVRKPIAEKLIR